MYSVRIVIKVQQLAKKNCEGILRYIDGMMIGFVRIEDDQLSNYEPIACVADKLPSNC